MNHNFALTQGYGPMESCRWLWGRLNRNPAAESTRSSLLTQQLTSTRSFVRNPRAGYSGFLLDSVHFRFQPRQGRTS